MELLASLAELLTMPVEKVMAWFDELGNSMSLWWAEKLTSAGIGITSFVVEGVGICVIVYALYCACRIMCSGGDDQKFSTYTDRYLIANLCYFFARYGGKFILHAIGG